MKKRVIGAVTIGQSPRVDLVPELIAYWARYRDQRERGAGRPYKGRNRGP